MAALARRVRIALALPRLFAYSPHRLQVCTFLALDIDLFREDKGHDPEKIRQFQRRRFATVDLVDQVVEHEKQWRQRQYELDNLRKDFSKINKNVGKLEIDACEIIKQTKENKKAISQKETEVQEANFLHVSIPISDDEANNKVVRTWRECRKEPNLKSHFELVQLLGIADFVKGSDIAGRRGYYLKGYGVDLNLALIRFGLEFLLKRGYELFQTPCLMGKEVMAKCAQLAQFDEELYEVTTAGDDEYLIATSEQSLCAYECGNWIHPTTLPRRYAGYSYCFRKEAGSHGKDTLGIFRVHQFQKVEQFCITSPNGNESWDMHEAMIKNSEDFYKELNIPYRIVVVVSGALNAAAAKKYDLEAWFPASKRYRELVSCSNCTDYQSRTLDIRYGQKECNQQTKQYVHLLNSTLTATQRTICCILENYQREDGVEIPKALRPFMRNIDFLPFKNALAMDSRRAKKAKPKKTPVG